MTIIVDKITGNYMSVPEMKKQHPNVSWGKKPSSDVLEEHGYAWLVKTQPPIGDVVTEVAATKGEDGRWYQSWESRSFTPGELDDYKRRKITEINAAYQQELGLILNQYPEAETLTWQQQELEARAWQADNSASTPYIDALATARGISKADLVPRIIAKADAWMQLSGAATGKRQRLEDHIEAAADKASVDAVQWQNT